MLMSILLQAALSSQQRLRTTEGALQDAWTAIASDVVKTLNAAMAIYVACAKTNPDNLGPPGPQLWLTLSIFLFTADVDHNTKQEMEKHSVALADWDLDEIISTVPIVIVKSCVNERQTKSCWVIRMNSLRRSVRNSMAQFDGCTYHAGRAPAGHLEDELCKFLEARAL